MTEAGETQAFNDVPPKASANELRAYITDKREQGEYNDHLAVLGYTLADRLDDEQGFNPRAYIAEVELIIYDCLKNKDRRTGEPMPYQLRSHGPTQWAVWRDFMQLWGKEAFGEEFGREVKEFYAELEAILEARRVARKVGKVARQSAWPSAREATVEDGASE